MSRTLRLIPLTILVLTLPVFAQRDPVLRQIAEPHPYYFREMYLPQLTTGPSSLAWSPDSKTLVYSMAGTLWLQKLGEATAQQLTDGPGYDYQPDWSSDGRWIVYDKYAQDAIELWAIDLESRQPRQLTKNSAVNLEPRFSPDGNRIAFVSTSYNGRFHIFTGRFDNGALSDVLRLTGENRSPLSRYYYSSFDMEISPVWSRDGNEILFISNRGHIYGTGGFWRMKAEPGAEPREIHYEETAWKARPDFSPDGHRLVYASYAGRAWNQLWLMPAKGGDPFPLSYGDFDNINPRWSMDGKQIAFISNRGGNTTLWIVTIPGGSQTQVPTDNRRYLHPVGRLHIVVEDEAGHATSARLFVTAADGRAYAPDDAWMHADDSFVRSERAFEPHYFHTAGNAELRVPAGRVTIGAMKGFEFRFEQQTVDVTANQTANMRIQLHPLALPETGDSHWISGDVHIHMNYAGMYRNTPAHLVQQAAAENLPVAEDLVVNKEQRILDIAYFRTTPDPASTAMNLLWHGQEFHTSYWGHLGLLHLTRNFILPDYSGYPGTAAASLYPTNANVADMAHEQNGVVGYVHPFDSYPNPLKDETLTDELPVDVALGKVDYIEVLGFSDHKSTARVWYQLLNCGFHLPTAAGTDAMANFASLRGPVGLNRVYVKVPKGPLDIDPWIKNLKQGRTFATNGPLLGFSLADKELGDTLQLAKTGSEVSFKAWVRSMVPLDHLEVVCNGQVTKELKLTEARNHGNFEGTLPITSTGWCLLRSWSDQSEYPILDLYPYATTSPIYIQVANSKPPAKQDAAYFLAWIDRLTKAVQAYPDWNSDAEKRDVLDQLSRAHKIYEDLER